MTGNTRLNAVVDGEPLTLALLDHKELQWIVFTISPLAPDLSHTGSMK